jgi:hypothetical protein
VVDNLWITGRGDHTASEAYSFPKGKDIELILFDALDDEGVAAEPQLQFGGSTTLL